MKTRHSPVLPSPQNGYRCSQNRNYLYKCRLAQNIAIEFLEFVEIMITVMTHDYSGDTWILVDVLLLV